jgi:CheY-like chemotaxis protein
MKYRLQEVMKYRLQELSGMEILFVGHDPEKLAIGRKRLGTAGRSFTAVFSADLMQTDYTTGRFGVVIVCDSVSDGDRETICLRLAQERPDIPVIVMPKTEIATPSTGLEKHLDLADRLFRPH